MQALRHFTIYSYVQQYTIGSTICQVLVKKRSVMLCSLKIKD